jgi:hypothetical protein
MTTAIMTAAFVSTPATYERVKGAASKQGIPVSAWIRMAGRLSVVKTRSDLRIDDLVTRGMRRFMRCHSKAGDVPATAGRGICLH